jgi:flagellar assembly protein FliH
MTQKGLNRDRTFKHHAFPEIPVNCLAAVKRERRDVNCFTPISFQGKGGGRSLSGKNMGNAGDPEVTERKAEHIERKAYREGFSKGEKEGLASGTKKLEPVLRNFRQALMELEQIKKKLYEKAEKDAIELALAVAEKIVCREVSTRQDTVLNVIKAALSKVRDSEKIKIKINPTDLAYLKEPETPLTDFLPKSENITLEGDENIHMGGCIIETGFGDIDARIDRQLQLVEEAFARELKKAGMEG